MAAVGSLLWLTIALHGSEESRFYTESVATSEGGQTTACIWLANGCRIRFLPPKGWSVTCQATNATVLLTHPDLKAAISLVLHREPEATSAPLALAAWRERVKDRHPKAVIVRESTCFIADRDGWGCDLVIPVEKGTAALVRVVVVPYPAGMCHLPAYPVV